MDSQAKWIKYVYSDGGTVTVQWCPILDGEWPFGEEVEHTVNYDQPLYGDT